jgi:hypothetical protein
MTMKARNDAAFRPSFTSNTPVSRGLRAGLWCPILVLTLLSGCTAMTTRTTPSYALFGGPIFLEGHRQLQIARERMSRYVCTTGGPVVCECASRISYACECGC